MAITRFTNPTMAVLVKGEDITTATVYLTVKQGTNEINISGANLTLTAVGSDTKVEFALTQVQAGSLNIMAFADIQVNWISGGVRYATEIAKVKVYENLYDEVIN